MEHLMRVSAQPFFFGVLLLTLAGDGGCGWESAPVPLLQFRNTSGTVITSLDFGSVLVGTYSLRTVQVFNPTGSAIEVTGGSTSSPAPIQTSFVRYVGADLQTVALPYTIAPGQGIYAILQYDPVAVGSLADKFRVRKNGSSQALPLGGTGIGVVSLEVSPNPAPAIQPGGTRSFGAVANLTDGTTRTSGFTWTSSDPSVATVNATGLASGVAEGVTQVSATLGLGTGSSSLAVEWVVLSFSPPPHYHVTEGDTLNFTVTASQAGNPLPVNASGLPQSATFDGAAFSWVGEFETVGDNGRHAVTFQAGGSSYPVTIGTTEYPLLGFDMYLSTGQPVVVPVPVPVGGRSSVLAGALFDDPAVGPSANGGRGTNSWSKFVWSIGDTSVAALASATNVAVIDGLAHGSTQIQAGFTDATLGALSAVAPLSVLDVVSIAVAPATLSFPVGATEPLQAIATLEGGSQTSAINFAWSSSNSSIATVTGGSPSLGQAYVGNVTGQALGTTTITASTVIGPPVSGSTQVTLVPPLRNQLLFGFDQQASQIRVVSIDTAGGSQVGAAMLPPYDDRFGPVDTHASNEILVAGLQSSTLFSQIQRIVGGGVTAVFTSNSLTPAGDTIDVEAIRYRPDGAAYFAMSEGQHTLSRLEPSGSISAIGGPSGDAGFGPTAIAPFGADVVYSAPWTFEYTQGGNVVGSAALVARFDDAGNDNDPIARVGVLSPQLAAPGGNLRILDGATGAMFRFVDLNGDGNHYFVQTTTVNGNTVKNAVDDPGERLPAGQLPSGFATLRVDSATGDMITTRIVGTVPQHIGVMRLRDLNSDGDVNDSGEQTLVFDAGAPPGTNIVDVTLKY
jgi:hypothetical protein